MDGNKSLFDPATNPLTEGLKSRLDIVSRSFFTARMRNLDMFEEIDRKMYAYITYYDGHGYCWIQPMKTKNQQHDAEYDTYIKRVNKAVREGTMFPLTSYSIKIGMDVVARYEADRHWYRAMVVEKLEDEVYMVLFVDFGNIQRCDVEDIKQPLHEKDCDHYHSALQAVCCRLYNIIPNSATNQESIDMKLTDFYTKNTTTLLELYVRNIRPDFVVDCDLFVPKTGTVGEGRLHRRHVGQFLVDSGLATFADPISARAITTPPTSQDSNIITIDDDEDIKDVKRDVKQNIKPNVKPNVKPDAKLNVKQDIKRDVKQNIKQDVKIDKILVAPRVVNYSF